MHTFGFKLCMEHAADHIAAPLDMSLLEVSSSSGAIHSKGVQANLFSAFLLELAHLF